MRQTHIWLDEPKDDGRHVTLGATIEFPDSSRQHLWYAFSAGTHKKVSRRADSFLIGSIFKVMEIDAPVHVHGVVSPALLRNIAEFQSAWSMWRHSVWQPVEITADREEESEPSRLPESSITAYTGGVDSSFTVWRHRKLMTGAGKRDIGAGLFVHGFDIPLDQKDAFDRAAAKARDTLNSLGIELITMSSNHKELNPSWNDTHGAGIISCLHFFSSEFGEGIIPSTYPYANLSFPWGSNPATDYLLSAGNFRIFHDGASTRRRPKLLAIKDWHEGYDSLRVCFSADEKDKNCCRCGKCVTNLLLMKASGLARPATFVEDVTADTLVDLNDLDVQHIEVLESLVEADKSGIFSLPLRPELEKCIKRNMARLKGDASQSENPLHLLFKALRK